MPRGKALESLRLIDAARNILAEIQPASVRAVCYRLFTAGLIPDMSKGSTNRVSAQLVYAREQGLISWEWVVDETREAERVHSWEDPAAYSAAVMRSYRRDRWALQPVRCEVWSEKGTVRGTLAPVLAEYGVTFRVMHGYASATAAYEIALEDSADPRPLVALYAGDWDPSGLHMSGVDLPRRLARYGGLVNLKRLALTEADTRDSALPSFAADSKRKDPRYRWFTDRYGRRCWELDALSPVVLRGRVAAAIAALIDRDTWERCGRAGAAERRSLQDVLGAWKEARR